MSGELPKYSEPGISKGENKNQLIITFSNKCGENRDFIVDTLIYVSRLTDLSLSKESLSFAAKLLEMAVELEKFENLGYLGRDPGEGTA